MARPAPQLASLQAKLPESPHGRSPAPHVREALAAAGRPGRSIPPVAQGRVLAPRLLPLRSKVLQPASSSSSSSAPPPPPVKESKDVVVKVVEPKVLTAAELVASVEAEVNRWSDSYSFKMPFNTGHGGPTGDGTTDKRFAVSKADFDAACVTLKAGAYDSPNGKKLVGFGKNQSASGGATVWDIILDEDINGASRNKMNYHILIK
jgi:hypothetical protein